MLREVTFVGWMFVGRHLHLRPSCQLHCPAWSDTTSFPFSFSSSTSTIAPLSPASL